MSGTDCEVVDHGHYDVLGVGVGPFNLGLSALLDGGDCDLDAICLDKASGFSWHEGMLIDGTTLEVPFLADLVTLADPSSEYSFLNYLRETGRIYQFYFYETFQIPRQEYNDYLQWVVDRLDGVQFDREVTAVREREDGEGFVVEAVDPDGGRRFRYRADDIVLGVGSRPFVPEQFRPHLGNDLCHTARYRHHWDRLVDADSITVVGSGQSAAEVVLDLLERQPEHDYHLDWLTRSDGFFPMEYSKLGLQHFTPEYTRYFYDLPQERKDELLPEQDLLYKGIDIETNAAIYEALYERSIGGDDPAFRMAATTEVEGITATDAGGYRLACHQWQEGESFDHETDAVVLGTGYHRPTPTFLDPVADRIDFDERGRYRVTEDYRVESDLEGRLFVQNGEVHTHGVGAPDLGLGCFRNAAIIERLAGREVYPIDRDTVFQDFGVEQFVDDERTQRQASTPMADR